MKMNRQSSPQNGFPWQAERSRLLLRICKAIKAAVAGGEKISRAIELQSQRHDGQPFKCDPAHRLQLRPDTLRQLWDKWRKSGETPDAFDLEYCQQSSALTATTLVRFTHYCASVPNKSLRAAWLNFIATPKESAGPAASVSREIAARHFSRLHFFQLQKLLAATQASRADLEIFKQQVIDGIRRRY